ncbi:hypothetical protein IKG60_01440 [Candidatus Saccharibacteria bacterium]|nr:hypothetical protein [Candidatus Saccharibacteria bacterium]
MDQENAGTPNPIAPKDTPTTNQPPVTSPAIPPEAPSKIPSETTSTTTSPTTPPTQPKKSNAPTIIACLCALLAVAGVAFGVYGMFLQPKPTREANYTESIGNNDASANSTTENDDVTEVVAVSPISALEVEKILADKYNFKDSQMVIFDGWHNYIEDFSQPNKLLFTINQMRDELGAPQPVEGDKPLVMYNIGFDDFKTIYENYFGEDEPLERKDYELNGIYERIEYNSDGNSFNIYSKTGLGGYSTVALKRKVVKTEGTENGFKATVATVTLNEIASQSVKDFLGKSGDGQGNEYYNIPISEEELGKIRESLSVYEFNFKKEGNDYKLTSITKLQ